MKTIIALSNFTLDRTHFRTFSELEQSLSNLEGIKSQFKQAEIEFSVGTDILSHSGFGPSIMDQLENFSYCEDQQVIGALVQTLFQKYLIGYTLSSTTDELMLAAQTPISNASKQHHILYVPFLNIVRNRLFTNYEEFSEHYEKVLANYPTSHTSYYERAKSHFDSILFHHDAAYTLTRVEGDFKDFSVSFTTCLSALNTFSPTNISGAEERRRATNSLTKYKCTGQGYSHENFKFDFPHPSGDETQGFELTCQYHLKPNDNNIVGDDTFYQNRIYFGFYPIADKLWKVAVAAIGPHINTDNENDRYAKPKNFNN